MIKVFKQAFKPMPNSNKCEEGSYRKQATDLLADVAVGPAAISWAGCRCFQAGSVVSPCRLHKPLQIAVNRQDRANLFLSWYGLAPDKFVPGLGHRC